MRFKKKAVLICLAVLCMSVLSFAQSEEYNPENDSSSGLTLIKGSNYEKTSVSGQSAVIVDNTSAVFDISDSTVYQNAERKKAVVSVTYYDEGGGVFYLTYDSFSGRKIYSDYEELYNTKNIVTRTFTLYDAKFSNSLTGGGDFSITAPKSSSTEIKQYKPLKILGVEVEIFDVSCPVTVLAKTNSAGNIFFDGDTKAFDILFENKFSSDVSFNVKYVIENEDKTAVFEKTDTLIFSANESKTLHFPVNVQEYGVYTLNVYLTDKNGCDAGSYICDFSVCTNANYENYDSKIGICPHFNWGRECVNGTYIIKNAGIDHIREGYSWSAFEAVKGNYAQTAAMKNYLDAAENNNIEILALAGYGNENYSLLRYDVPKTKDQRAAFAEYVYNMLSINRGRIKVVEVWNEPDIESFNTNGATSEECAYLVKAVYDRIHTDFPEVKICAFALANAYNQKGLDWLEAALKTDTDGDGEYDLYKYCDSVSVHHYITDCERITTDGEKLKELLNKYGFGGRELYHTEFGYSEVTSVNKWDKETKESKWDSWNKRGERNQAAFLVKYASSLIANKAGDVFYIYDFSNDGLAQNQPEQNFGLVKSVSSPVPYAAKPGLIAIAALNRIIGNCEADSVISNNKDLTVYKFKNKYGIKESFVIYSENGASVYEFSSRDGKCMFFDLYGNEFYPEYDGEKYVLNIGTEPVYAVVYKGSETCRTYLENGKIVVEGTFANGVEEEYAGVKVFDKNANLVYVNQFDLSDSLSLTFSFDAKSGENYSILIGMKSRSQVYKINALGTCSAKISLECGAESVDTYQKLAASESITLCAQIFDRAVSDFTIAAVSYKEGALLNVRTVKKDDMTFDDGRYVLNIDTSEFKNADAAGFYIIDSINSIMPLDKGIKLKK